MTKDEILKEFEVLKFNFEQLLNKNISTSSINNKVIYQMFPDNIDFMFNMFHLHKTDYEHYIFIDRYIIASLKESLQKKRCELSQYQTIKEEAERKILEINNLERKNRDVYLSKLECSRRLDNANYFINYLRNDVYKLTDCIANHKVFKKEEKFLPDEYIPLYKSWLKIKYAEIDFNKIINNETDINITELENSIKIQEENMQQLINFYNS